MYKTADSKYRSQQAEKKVFIQSNLNSLNPDGSFTMADLNLFLSPTKFFQ